MHRSVPSLAFFLALSGTPLAGQSGTIGLGYDVATSTRAMALGGAYVMGAGQADALFQHPSLLGDASGMTLDMQRWGSASGSTSAATVTSWFGGSLGIAVGVQSMQYGYPGPTAPMGRALDGRVQRESEPRPLEHGAGGVSPVGARGCGAGGGLGEARIRSVAEGAGATAGRCAAARG